MSDLPPPPLVLRRAGPALGGEAMHSIRNYVLYENEPLPTREALSLLSRVIEHGLYDQIDKDQQRRLDQLQALYHQYYQFGRQRSSTVRKRSTRKRSTRKRSTRRRSAKRSVRRTRKRSLRKSKK